MQISDAIAQNLFGFASALIGAIIGGFSTLLATERVIRVENAKEARNEEKEVQNMLDSLGVEIDALWSFHMTRVGALVEALTPDAALEFYYPLTQDYFTVYNTNAGKIGCIKDAALRKAIVVCYNKCKKVVDGFKYNNEIFRDYQNLQLHDGTASQITKQYAALCAYGQVVKEDHFELKNYIEEMLGLLDQRHH